MSKGLGKHARLVGTIAAAADDTATKEQFFQTLGEASVRAVTGPSTVNLAQLASLAEKPGVSTVEALVTDVYTHAKNGGHDINKRRIHEFMTGITNTPGNRELVTRLFMDTMAPRMAEHTAEQAAAKKAKYADYANQWSQPKGGTPAYAGGK